MSSTIKVNNIQNLAGDDSGFDLSTNDVVAIKTANTERMRVDANGRIGIKTSSPSALLHLGNADNKGMMITSSTSNAGHLNVFQDQVILSVNRAGADGSFADTGKASSAIKCIATNGDGNITFSTTDTNNTDSTQRMVIDKNGTVGINNSTPSGCKLEVSYANADVGMVVSTTDTFSSGNSSLIQFKEVDTVGGSIVFTNGGTATAYVTSSDYRLKENVSYEFDATTRLKQLKPCRFNFKKVPDITVDGFLAHEVTAVPEATFGEKDAVDKDGNIVPQGIDQSKLVPLLTKALQEAVAKIETLEAKVTALEGK